jgi:hypothetical protein
MKGLLLTQNFLNGAGGGLSKFATGKTKTSSSSKQSSSPRVASPLLVEKSSSPKKSSSKKSSSPVKKSSSSSRNRKVAAVAAFTKNRAAKIIQRLTMPYKNRVSLDFDERIKTYTQYSKYFSKYNQDKCLTVSKVNRKVTYSIDDNILLFKKIGSNSENGAIYLSKGKGVGSSYRFASKVMPINTYNIAELIIMEKLTEYVIKKRNPHFPVQYHTLKCTIQDNNRDLPRVIVNKQYVVSLCEIANGDTKMFVQKYYNNDNKILNAMMQMLISIYSFHCFGYLHNDTHWGNFLYHRIKSGGYIMYIINGEEIYLENIGYLWVIWDFGLAVKIDQPSNMKNFTSEYETMLVTSFMNSYPFSQSVSDISVEIYKIIKTCNKQFANERKAHSVFFDQILNSMTENLFLKKDELPSDAVIINKANPYRIG